MISKVQKAVTQTTEIGCSAASIALILLLSACASFSGPSAPGDEAASDQNGSLVAEPFRDPNDRRQTRAIWSWAGRKPMPGEWNITLQDVDELVATVDAMRLNVILLAVYADGAAFFEPSRTRFPDPDERLVNQSGLSAHGYQDALTYLLAIRDQRRADDDASNDFEVHAWFAVNKGGLSEGGEPPRDFTEPYMLNALFPEFRLKTANYYLQNDSRYITYNTVALQQPKARDYIVNLIAGLAEDYAVDGVHLDHIRTGGICFNNEPLDYPGDAFDYPGCQADYERFTQQRYGQAYSLLTDTGGKDTLSDNEAGRRVAAWQQATVTSLVQQIRDEVKVVNPELIVSVASVRNNVQQNTSRQLVSGQVAWEWLDQGLIDAVFPTLYLTNRENIQRGYLAFYSAVENVDRRSLIFPGLITFNPDNEEEWWSDLVAEQVRAVLEPTAEQVPNTVPPARGVALFLDRRLTPEAIGLIGEGPFREPTQPYWGN